MKNNIIKIIQISDLHLTKDNREVLGIATNAAFKKLLKNIKQDITDCDAIFLTGDISQDESKASYQFITNAFQSVEKEIFWIPGNHDSLNNMEEIFSTHHFFKRVKSIVFSSWNFIFLNTKYEGYEYGLLTKSELSLLEDELSKNKSERVAIVMHHHPINFGTPLIDNYVLKESDAFLTIVKEKKIDLIICGHVHEDYSLYFNTTRIESSPATCFQFAKKAVELNIEKRVGYKIHTFNKTVYTPKTRWF